MYDSHRLVLSAPHPMSFDDDDIPASAAPGESTEEAPTAEEALEEETQDFRLFGSLFRKKTNISAQTIRKGEKDFESHGTRAQENALEQSRQAMEEALSFTRVHKTKDYVRGWYFPDWWADWDDEQTELAKRRPASEQPEQNPFEDLCVRDRVVLVENSKGYARTMGRVITGQAKDRPARGMDWLLPEEALFLVERGDLDLWWPTRELEELFPPSPQKSDPETSDQPNTNSGSAADEASETLDEYDRGVPISLQTAYALLIGGEDERGKVSLHKFQVFAGLRRMGYMLQRAPSPPPIHPPSVPTGVALWQWLFSLMEHQPAPYGPLVRPGLYRSYRPIYKQLTVGSRHKPVPHATSPFATEDPYRIHFYVWKGNSKWKRTDPPPPDFYLSVADAQDTALPTFEEIDALIDGTPWRPPKATWVGPRMLYPRLKHGYRHVLIAVVDHGVINYMRFGEGAFGEELLFPRFDRTLTPPGAKGGKRGGHGGSRGGARGGARGGRGGRGGRGRGRR